METIKTIRGLLAGKKTYVIGILLVALGILQENTQTILEGLGLIFLRSGINK